ncbi:MAG TPA: Ppx/GppA phosphatase family protein [Gaiellaceae bacterium]|nr:Ppx/GppA phosphatase family protein [Gaiellaceae bacterium]
MTRVASIDLGTHSTRLLVADVDGGRVTEIERRLTITRLGEGVDADGRLAPEAVDRVREALTRYREDLERHGVAATLAVATSAVRDSANGRHVLEGLGREFGVRTRLLDGREEAELTFRGVLADRTSLAEGTLLLDIGGGSTEVTLGGPTGIAFTTSVQAGSVRLTERHIRSDPPTGAELAACAADVRALLPALDPHDAIGVAGTVTTVAAVELGLEPYEPERVHGHRLGRAVVDEVLDRLARLPLTERERVPGLEPARAPVIVAGIVILREVLDAYGLDAIEASEHDILHGAALAAAGA